jgi:hypothetical protein
VAGSWQQQQQQQQFEVDAAAGDVAAMMLQASQQEVRPLPLYCCTADDSWWPWGLLPSSTTLQMPLMFCYPCIGGVDCWHSWPGQQRYTHCSRTHDAALQLFQVCLQHISRIACCLC